MERIPLRRAAYLTQRITIPVDPETKQQLDRLRTMNGIDIVAWIRNFISSNIGDLKLAAENQQAREIENKQIA